MLPTVSLSSVRGTNSGRSLWWSNSLVQRCEVLRQKRLSGFATGC